jgi:hypothetical protein
MHLECNEERTMPHRRRASRRLVPILAVLILPFFALACREDPTPLPPLLPEQKPATVIALPTNTPKPTHTPEATELPTMDAAAGSTTEGVGLPLDGETPIVQFARIESKPWEPELLAEMHPNFSLQANGRIVYEFDRGDSLDGWYQTALTPTLALAFVETLWNEVGIAELAEKLEAPELRFETALDGSPAGVDTVGVIYVNSTAGSARLVIRQKDLENPTGEFAPRIKRLHDIIRGLQYWRNYTQAESSPLIRQGVGDTLGWWIERRVPFTPGSVLAFGTAARGAIPADAPILDWPLQGAADIPLAEQITAAYGETPVEISLAGGDNSDGVLVLREARTRPGSFWGPLWRDRDGNKYSIGLRPAIPGGNETVVDYEYVLPKRGIQPPSETP